MGKTREMREKFLFVPPVPLSPPFAVDKDTYEFLQLNVVCLLTPDLDSLQIEPLVLASAGVQYLAAQQGISQKLG